MKRRVLSAISAALLVACEQQAPTAVVPAKSANVLLNESPSAEASVIRVSVLMDGRSQLILRGNTAQWHHFDFAAPGRWGGRNDPTTINGVQWFPEWPGFSGEVRCGGCFSNVFDGVSPALPAAPVVLKVTSVHARTTVAILQQPSAHNDYTAVVELDDNGPFGGDTYTVDISFTYAPPTVVVGGPYTGAEGSALTFDGSASAAADGSALTYAWDFGDGATSTEASPTHAYADNGRYPVTLTVSDASGSTASASTTADVVNIAPSIISLELPTVPVAFGTAISAAVGVSDPGGADTHSAQIDWGDGVSSSAAVSGGRATATHMYAAPGVYSVSALVSDDDGGSAQATYQYVVVYDPSAGFVTGGGWIDSPSSACVSFCGGASGKAIFGFVAKYRQGAQTPDGNTEFHFKAGGLHFRSTSYQWLVVAGARAQYKGAGTINGQGSYNFLLTAIDGQLLSGGADAFRIKITDPITGALVYDNRLGAAEDSGDATTLGGGSITIHR